MTPPTFDFGSGSVSQDYDDVLVPLLFTPWAERLINSAGNLNGYSVLDLATGTGIVAQTLPGAVGSTGTVVAADINPEMLALAKRRCQQTNPHVEFVESPAHPLVAPSSSFDVVFCQQGFQFFPDRALAAKEIHRVLRNGGQVLASTWCPVTDCQVFGAITTALHQCGEPEIAEMMRIPFDFMPADELERHFVGAEFDDVAIERQEMDMVFPDGPEQAFALSYATPIGPKLRSLSQDKQQQFRITVLDLIAQMSPHGGTRSGMVSHVLTARKT